VSIGGSREVVWTRDPKDRGSKGHIHFGIRKPETPTKRNNIRLRSREHGRVDQGIARRG
jgi:hypothetical protein